MTDEHDPYTDGDPPVGDDPSTDGDPPVGDDPSTDGDPPVGDGPYDRTADCADGEEDDGPPDPQLDPTRSPGFGTEHAGLEDIEIDREDVTIGEATPAELTAGDPKPFEGMSEERLVATLVEGDLTARRRAAIALGKRERAGGGDATGGDHADDALTFAARNADDADVRQFAVESLARRGGDRAADVAMAATYDEDQWVRAEAVVALDGVDREEHADRLREALGDDHHAVRRNALISLFKLDGEDALPMLLDGLSDESDRVREWAAHMLGGVDDDEARAALRHHAATDESDIVRATAANALQADPARFRRDFTGMEDRGRTRPGEDLLNRTPNL